jgi:hypothetical protein
MKKISVFFVSVLLMAIISVSCNKNSAKEVATTWLTSFYHIDYETAKKFSTEDTKNLIATLQQFTNMVPDSTKKEMKKLNVNVKDVKEEGDKAVATYTISDNPGKDQTINLVKKDGKWLVQFSKNDQMSGAGDTMPGADTPNMGDSSSAPAGSMPDSAMH